MLLKSWIPKRRWGIGVVWDGGMPAFRLEVFPEYKAQRSAMPEELRVQLDHMDEILEAMNIPAITAKGFEADDALATMSRQVPEGVELFIVTGDQDAMQLVDGKAQGVAYHPRRLGDQDVRQGRGPRGVRRDAGADP